MWPADQKVACLYRGAFSSNPEGSGFYLPEQTVQMIFDKLPLCDALNMASLDRLTRAAYLNDQIGAVLQLTKPPFSLNRSQICNATTLSTRSIRNNGLTVLSDACAKGALANLTELSLRSNKIDDSSVILFANAITPDKNGKAALASLKELALSDNRIDDAGLASLAEACTKGALTLLEIMLLQVNEIGDAGVSALADACVKGALTNLSSASPPSPKPSPLTKMTRRLWKT